MDNIGSLYLFKRHSQHISKPLMAHMILLSSRLRETPISVNRFFAVPTRYTQYFLGISLRKRMQAAAPRGAGKPSDLCITSRTLQVILAEKSLQLNNVVWPCHFHYNNFEVSVCRTEMYK